MAVDVRTGILEDQREQVIPRGRAWGGHTIDGPTGHALHDDGQIHMGAFVGGVE